MGLCRYCALHFAISIVTKVFLREMEEVADVSEIMALASGAASYGYVAGMIERGKIQEEISKHKSAAGAAPSVNPVQGPAEEARGASETDLHKPMKGRVN